MKVCSVCKRCFDEPADSCIEAGHPPLSDSRNGNRLMVPGYSLDQLLAASVKADTYRARRLDCGRTCIIRVLPTDPNGEERFLRDAQVVATLFDSRVADIYEAGSLPGGECFVVEEDCDQPTLRGRLDPVGIPDLLTSVRIVEQAAEALHALHLKGLTHGAVRPENIHLDFDAEGLPLLKLSGIDLGGVTARNAISNKFLIDSSLDVIRYFAPEQCSGQSATAQTDVYSLGVVLYELVAGVPPFDAPKASALISMHLTQRPPDVKIEDLELRMLVAHSLSESLQKQPSFRQSSADLFARQMRLMEQLATHVSTPPPAVTVPAAPPKPQTVAFTCPAPTPVPAPAPVEIRSEYTVAETDLTFEPLGEMISETAYETEGLPSVEFERQPIYGATAEFESEEEQYELAEINKFEVPVSLDPVSRPSALVEHRQRLKLRKRRSKPLPASNKIEIEATAVTLRAEEVLHRIEEQPPLPKVQASTVNATTHEDNGSAAIPNLVEWEQPDDIPSLDDVLDQPLEHLLVPTPVCGGPEAGASQPIETHLIQWEQPEDDIPSIEDVIEVQLKEGVSTSSVFQFKPEDIDVVTEFQQRLSADLPENTAEELPEQKVEPSAHIAAEIDFMPTILGGDPERRTFDPVEPYRSIFSTSDGNEKTSRPFPYRSALIGIGLMLVAALLGMGGEPLWRILSAPASAEPETAAASAEKPSVPVQRVRPILPEPVETESEPPAIDEYRSSDAPIERSIVNGAPQPIGSKPSSSKPRRQERQAPDPITKSPQTASVPFSPSTVVITYGQGSVQRSDRSADRAQEKAARPAAERTAGATRPRIVPAPQR